jgi:hypothetical protein
MEGPAAELPTDENSFSGTNVQFWSETRMGREPGPCLVRVRLPPPREASRSGPAWSGPLPAILSFTPPFTPAAETARGSLRHGNGPSGRRIGGGGGGAAAAGPSGGGAPAPRRPARVRFLVGRCRLLRDFLSQWQQRIRVRVFAPSQVGSGLPAFPLESVCCDCFLSLISSSRPRPPPLLAPLVSLTVAAAPSHAEFAEFG